MYQGIATRNTATTREILVLEAVVNRTSRRRRSKKFVLPRSCAACLYERARTYLLRKIRCGGCYLRGGRDPWGGPVRCVSRGKLSWEKESVGFLWGGGGA